MGHTFKDNKYKKFRGDNERIKKSKKKTNSEFSGSYFPLWDIREQEKREHSKEDSLVEFY